MITSAAAPSTSATRKLSRCVPAFVALLTVDVPPFGVYAPDIFSAAEDTSSSVDRR